MSEDVSIIVQPPRWAARFGMNVAAPTDRTATLVVLKQTAAGMIAVPVVVDNLVLDAEATDREIAFVWGFVARTVQDAQQRAGGPPKTGGPGV